MSKWNSLLTFAALQGVNLTKFGDVKVEHSRSGDYIEMTKGIDGDAVTMAKNDVIESFRITQNYDSPIWGQLETWAKNQVQLTFSYKDNNTGESKSSTTAYVSNIGSITDGEQREFTLMCEQVQ